jgi:lipoprotein-anchoring transpeptidase ErfK/SrfK
VIEAPKTQSEVDKKVALQEEIAKTNLELQKLRLTRLQAEVSKEGKKTKSDSMNNPSDNTAEPEEKVQRLTAKEIKDKFPLLKSTSSEIVDVVGDIACAVGTWFCESESSLSVLLGKGIINTLTKDIEGDEAESSSQPQQTTTQPQVISNGNESDKQNHSNEDHNSKVKSSTSKVKPTDVLVQSENLDIKNNKFELTSGQRKIVRRNINPQKNRYYRESFDAGILDVRMEHLMYSLIKEFGEEVIQFTSTVRSSEVNKRVGGAKKSDHLDGNAVDISDSVLRKIDKKRGLPKGTMRKRVRKYLSKSSKIYGNMYVLFHKGHFHVSMRYLKNRHSRLPEIKTSKDLLALTKTYKRKKSVSKKKESNESKENPTEKKVLALYNNTVKKFEKNPRVAKGKTVYIINPHEKLQTMYGIKNNKIVSRDKISAGYKGLGNKSGSEKTPTGALITSNKHGNGVPKGGILVGKKYTGKVGKIRKSGNDHKSPVATRIVCLEGLESKNSNAFKRLLYFHGTLAENNLGKPGSKGCIRMSNDDIIKFYNKVPKGTLVYVPEKSQMA